MNTYLTNASPNPNGIYELEDISIERDTKGKEVRYWEIKNNYNGKTDVIEENSLKIKPDPYNNKFVNLSIVDGKYVPTCYIEENKILYDKMTIDDITECIDKLIFFLLRHGGLSFNLNNKYQITVLDKKYEKRIKDTLYNLEKQLKRITPLILRATTQINNIIAKQYKNILLYENVYVGGLYTDKKYYSDMYYSFNSQDIIHYLASEYNNKLIELNAVPDEMRSMVKLFKIEINSGMEPVAFGIRKPTPVNKTNTAELQEALDRIECLQKEGDKTYEV